MSQPPNQTVDEARCERLIRTMNQVELEFSGFLKGSEGERGEQFLVNKIKLLRSDPEGAITKLKEKFKAVVDPILIEEFKGTWMGFLLWDSFNKTFRILHNYTSDEEDLIHRGKYDFVSDFINSPEFYANDFKEPMTNIIFAEATQKKVLIFSWEGIPDNPEVDEERLGNMKPVTVPFYKLGGDEIEPHLKVIENFIEEKYKTPKGLRGEVFQELAKMISDLAKKVLKCESANETWIIKKAVAQIDKEFSWNPQEKEHLVNPEDLCQAVIWNRLFSEWRYLYYIPARFFEGSAVSGIICAFQCKLKPEEYIILSQIVNRVFSVFNFGFYIQQFDVFALRSATAAIMARNKSHIHGSHIEHGLRNKMGKFEQIVLERLRSDTPFYNTIRKELSLTREGGQ